MFYSKLADAYNEREDNDELLVAQFANDDDIGHALLMGLKIDNFSPLNSKKAKEMVSKLIEARLIMKKNMTVSGSHSDRASDYAPVACAKVGALSKLELLYFYRFCEEHKDQVDASFGETADGIIGGSGSLVIDNTGGVLKKRHKKSGSDTVSQLSTAISENTVSVSTQMAARNTILRDALAETRNQNENNNLFKAMETTKDYDLDPIMRQIAKNQAMPIAKKLGLVDAATIDE